MKFINFAILLTLLVGGAKGFTPEHFFKSSRALLAQGISEAFKHQLIRQMKAGVLPSKENVKAGILPELPDPIALPSIDLPIKINIVDLDATGNVAACTPEIKGLSQVTDDLIKADYSPVDGLQVEWDLNVPSTAIQGLYQLSLFLNTTALDPNEITANGEGEFMFGVEELFFQLKLNATDIMDKINVDGLWVDFGFADILLSAENLEFNGEEWDIGNLASLIKTLFNLIWTDETKPVINEMVRCSVDHLIGDCSVLDLMNFIFGCLKTDTNPACFGEESEMTPINTAAIMGTIQQGSGYCDLFTDEPTNPSTGQGSDGTTQGSDGTTQGSDGTTQGSDGSTQGSDGTTQGSDGTTQGSGSTPNDDSSAPSIQGNTLSAIFMSTICLLFYTQ